MAKTKETFEDYLKKYIKNKAISSTKEGYAEWLKTNGVDSEKIYTDTLRDIEADYQKARSEHGAAAEKLAELGLSSSGYSDYLNGVAYYQMQKNKLIAQDRKASNEKENLKGYRNYLEKHKDKAQKTFTSVLTGIENAKITDYESAYEYAISAGLEESDATAAAKLATDSVVRKIKESIIKEIISNKLSEKETAEYAKALGLSEEDAKKLSEYAKSVSGGDYVKAYPDFYKPQAQ
jgi:hypothetical protein